MDTQFSVSASIENASPIAGSAILTDEPMNGVRNDDIDAAMRTIALLPVFFMLLSPEHAEAGDLRGRKKAGMCLRPGASRTGEGLSDLHGFSSW